MKAMDEAFVRAIDAPDDRRIAQARADVAIGGCEDLRTRRASSRYRRRGSGQPEHLAAILGRRVQKQGVAHANVRPEIAGLGVVAGVARFQMREPRCDRADEAADALCTILL